MTSRPPASIAAWLWLGSFVLLVGAVIGPWLRVDAQGQAKAEALQRSPLVHLEHLGLTEMHGSVSGGVPGFETPSVKQVYSFDGLQWSKVKRQIDAAAQAEGFVRLNGDSDTVTYLRDLTQFSVLGVPERHEVHVELTTELLNKR